MPKRKIFPEQHAPQARSGGFIPWMPHGRVPAGAALIIIIAFIVYLPSIGGGFILDDDVYVTNNPIINSSDGLYRFWFTAEPADYYPVSNTILWIEWRLWGLNPIGYHITNLVLHIVESLLIWTILRKLSVPGAFLASIIFAVHPVNVESVAWIAQLKGMSAMLFFLLSILWYVKYRCSRHTPCAVPAHGVYGIHSILYYWLSLAAFALAMLSKGSVAILPVLLLGIIWWMREKKGTEKMGTGPLSEKGPVPIFSVPFFSDLVHSAPFFVVAAALTGVNVWCQTHGTDPVIRTAGFIERLLGAGGAVWFYLYKAFLPVDLIFVYPQWRIEVGNPLWWLTLLAALIVTALLWRYRTGWSRPFLFAWGFFCTALVPVLGFVDVGFMKYSLVADHYQHIAIIGVIALVAAFWSLWPQQARGAIHWVAAAVAFAAVGVLAFLTWQQNQLYRDARTLYRATLEKNPGCWMAYNNLGVMLLQSGRTRDALEHYEQAIRLKPEYPEAHNNLGNLLSQTGRLDEAIKHYEQAIELWPNYPDAHYNLGCALAQAARLPEAVEHYTQALRLKPRFPEACDNLGNALSDMGRPREAIIYYERAIRLEPNLPEAHNNMGIALIQTGKPEEAIESFKQALQIKPDYIDAYTNLVLAYAGTNQTLKAIATARKAIEIARSQGQTEQARRIEDWLSDYQGPGARGKGPGKDE